MKIAIELAVTQSTLPSGVQHAGYRYVVSGDSKPVPQPQAVAMVPPVVLDSPDTVVAVDIPGPGSYTVTATAVDGAGNPFGAIVEASIVATNGNDTGQMYFAPSGLTLAVIA